MASLRLVVLAGLLALGLAFSVASPAAAMTQGQAGTYYSNAICPGNAKAANVVRVLFRGKQHFYAKQMHGDRLRKVQRALAAWEQAQYNGGRRLLNPPSAWPSVAAGNAATNMGRAMVRESNIISVLRSRSGQRFVNVWNNQLGPQDARVSARSRTARAYLNLPPNGQGC
jgi:hypothetical protein